MILVFIAGCPSKSKKKEVVNEKISEEVKIIDDVELAKNLFEKDKERINRELTKKEERYKSFFQTTLLLTKMIEKNPENCSLYAFRAYLAALGRSDKLLFPSLELLEKFNPQHWSTNLLIAYIYYQKWNDEKTMLYLNKTLDDYCSDKKNCSSSSDEVVRIISNVKERVKIDAEKRKNTLSKLELDNHPGCFFMELNQHENLDDEEVFWSGDCKNDLAEGNGILEYKISGSKYKVSMEKGYVDGDIEIEAKSGVKWKGKMKNGFRTGKWEYIKNGKVLSTVYYDHKDEGRANGKIVEIITKTTEEGERKKIKIEGEMRKGVPLRKGFSLPSDESGKEYSFTIYRHTQETGRDFKLFGGKIENTSKALEKAQSILSKELNVLNELSDEVLKKNSNCKIPGDLDSFLETMFLD